LLNPNTATLAANESSNLLILTDTQSNVRRIVTIVSAIDTSVSGELEVKVFHLAHAAADKAATVINTIYGKNGGSSSASNSRNANDPMARMFGPPGAFGGNQGTSASTSKSSGRSIDVSAAADTGTNSLVVRAAPAAMKAITQVVAQLDMDTSASDGVMLYKVRNAKAADLATAMTSLFSGTKSSSSSNSSSTSRTTTQNRSVPTASGTVAAAGPGGGSASSGSGTSLDLTGQVVVVAETVSNSVLVLSPERNFDRLRRVLEDLDQPMRQVLVRALVAEMTIEDGTDIGVELSGINPSSSTTSTRTYTDFTLSDNTVGANGFLMQSGNFQATVHALASVTRFNVVSRPYILTADNKEATVNVVQEVPVATGSRTDTNNNVTTTFDREEVGIILTVTPQINSDGRVVLTVTQELSALTDQTMQIAKDVTSPIIKKRTMTTTVTMDRGQTAVIGGLVSDSLTETVRKVPWLGDIPGLGWLFSRTERTKAKTEMLVFLTPQVVMGRDDLDAASTQVRGDMKQLKVAVENEQLQAHLDELVATRVGEPLTWKPVRGATPHPPGPTSSDAAPTTAPAVQGDKP
jgi:general secretion pathway protein D